MKKILALLLASAMLFSFAACSSTEKAKDPADNKQDITDDNPSSGKTDDPDPTEKPKEDDKQNEDDKPSDVEVGPDTVYITPSGSKYHLSSGCAGKNAIATTYGEVKDTHQPCKTCVKEIPTEPEQPDEPTTPTEPEQPDEPTTPTEPEQPDEPTTPTEPEQPDEPTTPTEPEQPDEPTTPTEPEQPDEPTTPTEPEKPVVTDKVGETLKAAYALAEGKSLTEKSTLTGVITEIDDPWNATYSNISVVIKIEGYAEYPILCYRIKGEGAKDLAVGDTITVTGTLTNYKGTIEFTSGGSLDKVVKAEGTTPSQPTEPTTPDEPTTGVTVYVTPTGKKYHYKASCAGKNAIEKTLDQVKNTHTPCKTCAKQDLE